MGNEIMARLVAMGFATYNRVTVGLSSHALIQAPPGLIIAITNIEVLPYVFLINSGLPSSAGNMGKYASNSPDVSSYVGTEQDLEGRASAQLRIIQDGQTMSNYALRPNIKYDASLSYNTSTLDNQFAGLRTFGIDKTAFDCLFFARNYLQLSFVSQYNGDNVSLITGPFNQHFNLDFAQTSGINGTNFPVNYYASLNQGPPENLYFPYTIAKTSNPPASVPGLTISNDTVIYPYANASTVPVYLGSGLTAETVGAFSNVPLLNIEYVTFNAGNDPGHGFFSNQILEALGWK
jgi:hypothetical protein